MIATVISHPTVTGRITQRTALSGRISGRAVLRAHVGIGGSPYSGEYTVTPTQSVQILNTSGKMMLSNMTIEPIPNNYGLITWNGAVLTVS